MTNNANQPIRAIEILLVEDNPINAKLAKIILQRMGFPVHVAHNGKEALEALVRNRRLYNIILMDMQMPEMDGIEATTEIRQLPATVPQPRIIALTANVMPDDQARCMAAGMDGFLGKPVSVSTLSKGLAKVHPIRS